MKCILPLVLVFLGASLVRGETVETSAEPGASAGVRPNLVFILTDDQRYDTLGCTGNTFTRTPHLDRLAAEGVLFANAHVTSAICTPSRASYFLGQYERRHGVNFNSGTALAPEAWAGSYPVLLREAGYFTGYVGKNHVPVGAHGYDTGLIEESFDFWFAGHKHLGFYPKGRHPNFHAAKADTQVEILEEGAATFLDAEQTFIEGAGAFLKSRPKDKPFCLSVSFNVPHGAGTESMKLLPSDPELYRTAYRDRLEELNLAPNYLARAGIRNPKLPPDVLRTGFRQTGYDYVDTPAGMKERLIRETQTVTGHRPGRRLPSRHPREAGPGRKHGDRFQLRSRHHERRVWPRRQSAQLRALPARTYDRVRSEAARWTTRTTVHRAGAGHRTSRRLCSTTPGWPSRTPCRGKASDP